MFNVFVLILHLACNGIYTQFISHCDDSSFSMLAVQNIMKCLFVLIGFNVFNLSVNRVNSYTKLCNIVI